MTNVYTGLVLMVVCSILMLLVLVNVIIKIKRLDLKSGERVYKNKAKLITFFINYCALIPIVLIAAIALASMVIMRSNLNIESDKQLAFLKLYFNFAYLFYVVLVLISVLANDFIFNGMFIVEKQETLFFLDGIQIEIEKIYSVAYNLKRSRLMIGFYNKINEKSLYTLRFNENLKNWMKTGLLKNPRFEEAVIDEPETSKS